MSPVKDHSWNINFYLHDYIKNPIVELNISNHEKNFVKQYFLGNLFLGYNIYLL